MSAVNGNKNYKPKPKPGQSTKKFFDLPNIGEWTALEIGQRHEENTEAFTFYVSINQTEVHSVLNTQPRNFSDMKVCINDKLTVITVHQKLASHYKCKFSCLHPIPGTLLNLEGSGDSW